MSGGLSNADFRRLLATPHHGATPVGGGGGGGEAGEQKKKHKKPGGGSKPGAKPGVKPRAAGKEGGEKEAGPQYRDRAAERRQGFSADFEGVPDDLVGLLEGNKAALSYEDSKYLGGDVAHTHLVKGLDFALLHKVRAEQEQEGKRGGGLAGSEDKEEPKVLAKKVEFPGQQQVTATTFITPLGRAVHAFFFDPVQRGAAVPVAELFLPRRTAFVYELEEAGAPDIPTTLRRSKEDCPKVREMVLGGLDGGVLEKLARIMSYMTVQGGGKKKLKRREREALLQRHGIALQGPLKSSGGATGGKSRLTAAAGEEEGEEGAAAAAGLGVGAGAAGAEVGGRGAVADKDEDDIFGDAGTDYQPTVKDRAHAAASAVSKQQQQGQGQGPRAGGYFGGAATEDLHLPPLPADEGAPPPPPEEGDMQGPAGPMRPPSGYEATTAYAPYPEADAYQGAAADGHSGGTLAAAGGVVTVVARQERANEKRRAAEMLGRDSDAYAECYPSYYDHSVTVEDSEEEGGPPVAEQGALSRRDFASEADWEEYQAQGHAPSRQAEGRAKVRQQQRVASKEKNKITSQLGKIQKIMEDKGYDHTAAFTKGQRNAVAGGEEGGSAGAGGEDGGSAGSGGLDFGGAPAGMTKKRRI